MSMFDKDGHDLLAPCVYCGHVRVGFCAVCGVPLCAICYAHEKNPVDGKYMTVCSPYKKLECRATIEMGVEGQQSAAMN